MFSIQAGNLCFVLFFEHSTGWSCIKDGKHEWMYHANEMVHNRTKKSRTWIRSTKKGRGLARAEFTEIVAEGGGVLLSGIGDRQDMTSIACLLVLKYIEFLYFNYY